jgi:3-deoxy-7-phosphoheptulonate synthase
MAAPQLRARTGLPVIVDPSHSTGRRDLVAIAARAAIGVDADGIIVEVHPNPAEALSDGPQSLTITQFRRMMAVLRPWLSLWKNARQAELTMAAVVR